MRDLTVMFSDVRGFTPLSERLPPGRIVTLLNILFSALGRRIVGEMGTIDKFIGDAVEFPVVVGGQRLNDVDRMQVLIQQEIFGKRHCPASS